MSERRYFKMPSPKSAKRPAPPPAPSWKNPDNALASRLRSSDRWQRLRAKVLTMRPLCAICGHVADQVHHIDAKNPDLFFAIENLAPVCEDCHKKVNSAYRRGIAPDVLFPVAQRIKMEEPE